MSLSHEYHVPNSSDEVPVGVWSEVVDLEASRRECEDLGDIGRRFSPGARRGGIDSIVYAEGITMVDAASRAVKLTTGFPLKPNEELVPETHFDPVFFSGNVFGIARERSSKGEVSKKLGDLDALRDTLEMLSTGQNLDIDDVSGAFDYLYRIGEGFISLARLYEVKKQVVTTSSY